MTPIDRALPDGTRVRLRLVRADDKARLAAGVQGLSARTRYQRFLAPIPGLTDKTLRYLTEIDNEDHLAWIAVDPDAPGEPALGVARYVRSGSDSTVAEIAAVVGDEVQGRGLGSLLLSLLAESAREHGIRTFHAVVLEENRGVRRLLERLGARGRLEQGVLEADVPVGAVHSPMP
jgi:RimJ/RimL family protein N-acetyltransferase